MVTGAAEAFTNEVGERLDLGVVDGPDEEWVVEPLWTDTVLLEGLAEEAFPDAAFWFSAIVLRGEGMSKNPKEKVLRREK